MAAQTIQLDSTPSAAPLVNSLPFNSVMFKPPPLSHFENVHSLLEPLSICHSNNSILPCALTLPILLTSFYRISRDINGCGQKPIFDKLLKETSAMKPLCSRG